MHEDRHRILYSLDPDKWDIYTTSDWASSMNTQIFHFRFIAMHSRVLYVCLCHFFKWNWLTWSAFYWYAWHLFSIRHAAIFQDGRLHKLPTEYQNMCVYTIIEDTSYFPCIRPVAASWDGWNGKYYDNSFSIHGTIHLTWKKKSWEVIELA